MTAQNWMIGDWYQWYAECRYYPYQVKPEDFTKDYVANFEPIPLTPEILEKIGFIKINSQRYDYGNPNTDCYIKVNPKKGMIHVNGRNANCNLYNHFFFHQLQQAMRLCGLTELANNFKIE